MDGYSYNITLSNGRRITVDSFDPLNADDIRKLKKQYEDEEGKGGPSGWAEMMGRRVLGGGRKAMGDVYSTVVTEPAAWLAEKTGIGDPKEYIARAQMIREAGSELDEAQRRKALEAMGVEDRGDLGGFSKFTGDVGGAAGSMIPALGGALASKNPAVAYSIMSGIAGSQMAGTKKHEYLQNVLPELKKEYPDIDEYTLRRIGDYEVHADGVVQGVKTGLITAAGAKLARALGGVAIEAPFVSRAAGQAAPKGVPSWLDSGKIIAATAASEGIEEGLDSTVEQAIELTTYYPEKPWFGRAEDGQLGILQQAAYEGAIGITLGTVIGTAKEMGDRSAAKKDELIRADEAKKDELIRADEEVARRRKIIEDNQEAINETTRILMSRLSEKTQNFLKSKGNDIEASKVLKEYNAEVKRMGESRKTEAEQGRIKEITEAINALAKQDISELTKLERKLSEETSSELIAERAAITKGEAEVNPPQVQRVLEELGVDTVEEAYQALSGAKPEAPQGEAAIPSTRRPLREEGLLPREQEAGSFMAEPKPIRWGGPVEVPTPDIEGAGPHPSGIPAGPKEMAPDVLSQTGPDAGIPLRTTDQIFGLNVKSTLPRREAAEAQAEAGPEFTGPSTIAGAPPDVLAPDPASKEADLGFLKGPRKLTQEERALLRKKERGKLVTTEEAGQIQGLMRDAKKYLEERLYERKKVYKEKYGEDTKLRTSGITDQQAVDAGIKAGIAALRTGREGADIMDLAIYNAKRNLKNINSLSMPDRVEELQYSSIDRLAGPGATEAILKGIGRWANRNIDKQTTEKQFRKADEELWGVTELGENQGYTSPINNFDYFSTGKYDEDHNYNRLKYWINKTAKSTDLRNIDPSYGLIEGSINDAINFKIQLEESILGSGLNHRERVTLRRIESEGIDPASFSVANVELIEGREGVSPLQVTRAMRELTKAADEADVMLLGTPVAFASGMGRKGLHQERLIKFYEKHGGKMHTSEEDLFSNKPSIIPEPPVDLDVTGARIPKGFTEEVVAKLKKARAPMMRYLRENKRRMSSLAPDLLLAQLVDSSLSLAIKVLSATSSVTKAIDSAWDSLGDRQGAYKRDDFMAVMMPRLLTASNQIIKGATPSEAVRAATIVDETPTVPQMKKELAATEEGTTPPKFEESLKKMLAHSVEHEAQRGFEPPDYSDRLRIYDLRDWLYNTTVGRSEDSMEQLGMKQLAIQWNSHEQLTKRKQDEYLDMLFPAGGKYDSTREILNRWLTIKAGSPDLQKADKEFSEYRGKVNAHNFGKFYKMETVEMPDIEALSPAARELVENAGAVYEAIGGDARDIGVYQIDEKGKSVLGEFGLGKEGIQQGMHHDYNRVLQMINSSSLDTKSNLSAKEKGVAKTLVDLIGRTNESVKDLDTLIEWRDSRSGVKISRGPTETHASMQSQVEKKRTAPLHPDLIDTTTDGFVQYIMNATRRISEIEHFGQEINPYNKGKDLFDLNIERLMMPKSKGGLGHSEHSAAVKRTEGWKRDAYGINPPLGEALRGPAIFLDSVASGTLLSGPENAMRNYTGAFQAIHAAYYAGNLWAAGKVIGKGAARKLRIGKEIDKAVEYMTLGRVQGLTEVGMDAAELKSWAGVSHNMSHLMTGRFTDPTEVGGEMKWHERSDYSVLPLARKGQQIGLSALGFKESEKGVRGFSGLIAYQLAMDNINANKEGIRPKMVEEFKSFVGDLKNVNVDKLLEGDIGALQSFVETFGLETQGGYTPNQLPHRLNTPAGKFWGKFMPWGAMMNQLHYKNMKRRQAAKKGQPMKLWQLAADISALGLTFGLGGELWAFLMEKFFGRTRDVASVKEIWNSPLPLALEKAWDRLYDDILYTGVLGVVFEVAQSVKGVVPSWQDRSKDITDPATFALVKNLWHWVQDSLAQDDFNFDTNMKYLERQISAVRGTKRLILQGANKAGVEWGAAIKEQKRQDYRLLRDAAKRYAEEEGVDVITTMSGGRYLPTPMTPFYNELRDNLYLGDVKGAVRSAEKAAEKMGHSERAWANVSSSVRGSQPLKVGRFSNTDMQKDFMRWASSNLPNDDLKRIVRVQQGYINTANLAGLLSTGDPQSVRNMKRKMNKKKPRGRSRSRSVDPLGQRDRLLREAAGF